MISSDDPYDELIAFCKKNAKKLIFSHLNVNSLSSKFVEIHEILTKGVSNMFFLLETKLDDSYPYGQFEIDTFVTHRIDRNAHGGGLLCYVRQTIPHKSTPDIAININGVESIVIQVKTNIRNSFFIHIYINIQMFNFIV